MSNLSVDNNSEGYRWFLIKKEMVTFVLYNWKLYTIYPQGDSRVLKPYTRTMAGRFTAECSDYPCMYIEG